MTLTMPPKGVDAVNSLKSDLQENIERFSKIDSTHSSYKECHDKIGTALKKLGKLDINVATLHVTKIGKLMTKYERELSKELSNIAKDNNVKWKELLNAYREEFKKKKFIKLNEVKEEPLSQNSYNDLLASQEEPCDEDDDDVRDEPNNEMNDSFDMLLASQGFGPDNDNENVFLSSTPMNQELPHTKKNDTITNNTSPDKTIDVPSKHFLTDMRGVVGTLTTTLSTVEIECTKMKTMIEYLNNKLNDYENNLFHQRRCVSTSSKSNPIKETFEKTGRAVMPKLLKPSPGKNKSPTSTEPSENSILYTSNHRISRVSNTDKSKQPSTSNNDSNNSTCSNIQKSVHSSTMSINNDHIENACNGININDVNMENLNPCTSSNVDETLPYPLSLIKQEPDDGIEFHRLSNSNSPNNPSADENDNTKKKEESEKNVSQKMKRKSFDENNVVPSKITHGNNNINSISDKISQISQSLKRRSIDENTIADTPSPSNTKNSLLYRESPNSSGISLKGSGESSRSRSSVFDVDSDGFTIPKVVNQNDIQLSGEQVLLKGGTDSKNTTRMNNYMFNILYAYTEEKEKEIDFDNTSKEEFNDFLKTFYMEVRKTDGTKYKKNSYRAIRSSIQRRMKELRGNDFDIIHDKEFKSSNSYFNAECTALNKEGLGGTDHHPMISKWDMMKLYTNTDVFSLQNPIGLQRKVFFELMLHFYWRGERENLRNLKVSDFALIKDRGLEMVVKVADDSEERMSMVATGNTNCPVSSFKLYISKLDTELSAFFQRPKKNFKFSAQFWYDNTVLGENTLNNMMKRISREANLSHEYTNHCVRATAPIFM